MASRWASCCRIERSSFCSERAGLEPKLLPQQLARLPIDGKRVGLPTSAVKREHQLPPQPLLERVRSDQRLELANQVTISADREIRLDPILERRQLRLPQPRDRVLRERLVRNVGKRLAPPQSQRRRQLLPRASSDRPEQGQRRPSALSSSNLPTSTCSGSTASRYPRPSVTITDAPSTLRRRETYTCTVLVALAGARSPHSSSTKRSSETTSPRWSKSSASNARCPIAPSENGSRPQRPPTAQVSEIPRLCPRPQPDCTNESLAAGSSAALTPRDHVAAGCLLPVRGSYLPSRAYAFISALLYAACAGGSFQNPWPSNASWCSIIARAEHGGGGRIGGTAFG